MSADPSGATPLLEMRSVNAHYGAVHALRDVNLSIYEGEMVCLLGGNASGKSTTLKTLLGMLKPTSGEVVLDGEVVNDKPISYRVARGVTMVPENRRLFKRLSVRENLDLGAYSALRRRSDRGRHGAGLRAVPPGQGAHQPEVGHPVGRRAADGRHRTGADVQAGVLLMDEPSMGLAPALVQQNFELIQQIHAAGLTVFMVSRMPIWPCRSPIGAGCCKLAGWCSTTPPRTCWPTPNCEPPT